MIARSGFAKEVARICSIVMLFHVSANFLLFSRNFWTRASTPDMFTAYLRGDFGRDILEICKLFLEDHQVDTTSHIHVLIWCLYILHPIQEVGMISICVVLAQPQVGGISIREWGMRNRPPIAHFLAAQLRHLPGKRRPGTFIISLGSVSIIPRAL